MAVRIEVTTTVFDTRADIRRKKFTSIGYKAIKDLWILDVYTFDKSFSQREFEEIGSRISNPVTQSFAIVDGKKRKAKQNKKFTWAIEIGFLPGVTDNISHTTKEIAEDLLHVKFTNGEDVYTSQLTFIEGKIAKKQAQEIANTLYNPIIQRAQIKSYL
jgi:phosphoribosylformylglycinamidine synthase